MLHADRGFEIYRSEASDLYPSAKQFKLAIAEAAIEKVGGVEANQAIPSIRTAAQEKHGPIREFLPYLPRYGSWNMKSTLGLLITHVFCVRCRNYIQSKPTVSAECAWIPMFTQRRIET